jgi:hypothetical protein
MAYDVPGGADQASALVVDRWNARIGQTYTDLAAQFGSRFISADPSSIQDPAPAVVKWFGDPAEPGFCLGSREWALRLCDWGARGRSVVQNEYCEFAVVTRPDANGTMRPKRVQITTELREYWVTVARVDPDGLADMAESVLGFRPTWPQLYGLPDPNAVSEEAREWAFATQCAGHGNDEAAVKAGVPRVPVGDLNRANALFMTHTINGLDDLIYIVMFGAKPYAVPEGNARRPASMPELFTAFGVQHLACRHADPAAAQGACDVAWQGAQIAFANPLGMYIQSFADDVLTVDGGAIPASWVVRSRGTNGLVQRLEVGPPDDETDAWLDDIMVATGAEDQPLIGGFQLLENLEVGPNAIRGPSSTLHDDDYVPVSVVEAPINCSQADVCSVMRSEQTAWQAAHPQPSVLGAGRARRVVPTGG